MTAPVRYPDVSLYIANAMMRAGIPSNAALFRMLHGHLGPEFLRIIINGEKLPDVDKARAIAKALNVDFVEFLCVLENARFQDRGISKIVRVIPAK